MKKEIDQEEKTGLAGIEEFLNGPLWPLCDANGRWPTRESIYRERVEELCLRYQS
jgi:hypothetical protein